MNSQATTKHSHTDEIGPAMKGADVLVHALEREGVDVVYAYPGVLQWNCIKH